MKYALRVAVLGLSHKRYKKMKISSGPGPEGETILLWEKIFKLVKLVQHREFVLFYLQINIRIKTLRLYLT